MTSCWSLEVGSDSTRDFNFPPNFSKEGENTHTAPSSPTSHSRRPSSTPYFVFTRYVRLFVHLSPVTFPHTFVSSEGRVNRSRQVTSCSPQTFILRVPKLVGFSVLGGMHATTVLLVRAHPPSNRQRIGSACGATRPHPPSGHKGRTSNSWSGRVEPKHRPVYVGHPLYVVQ